MPDTAPSAPAACSTPILSRAEADRRTLLLAELQSSLSELGVGAVLARHHRLVLQDNRVPSGPSGMTDPRLHIFTPDGTCIATTNGTAYHLAAGQQCPAGDPAAAATFIRHGQHAAPRA
jgi:hypothetical protein